MLLNHLGKPIAVMLLVSGFAVTSIAAEKERKVTSPPATQTTNTMQTNQQEGMTNTSQMSQMPTDILRISEIVGVNVENPQGNNLGEISDVVVDPSDGTIAYAVLEAGGFLGLGEKFFAIPWRAFQVEVDDDDKYDIEKLILNVDKDRMQQAPGFDKDNWPNMADAQWGQSVHEYYGQQDYWQQRQNKQQAQSSSAMNQQSISATVQQVEGTTVEIQVPQELVKDIEAGDRVEVSIQKQMQK